MVQEAKDKTDSKVIRSRSSREYEERRKDYRQKLTVDLEETESEVEVGGSQPKDQNIETEVHTSKSANAKFPVTSEPIQTSKPISMTMATTQVNSIESTLEETRNDDVPIHAPKVDTNVKQDRFHDMDTILLLTPPITSQPISITFTSPTFDNILNDYLNKKWVHLNQPILLTIFHELNKLKPNMFPMMIFGIYAKLTKQKKNKIDSLLDVLNTKFMDLSKELETKDKSAIDDIGSKIEAEFLKANEVYSKLNDCVKMSTKDVQALKKDYYEGF
ncbi:hypothetical protein L2E82_10664 [Cichorium intybus]|uniref:Uncharacterized protein n=1 Tax=Cichorium intybus TaxID=13427 RepID=A0ACB9GC82_CICIN|nr:hypothetical protein L2E82_10664 [Cichorium intybus]